MKNKKDTYSVYFNDNTVYCGFPKSQIVLLLKIKEMEKSLDEQFEAFDKEIQQKYLSFSIINEDKIRAEKEYFMASTELYQMAIAKLAQCCILPTNKQIVKIEKNSHGVGLEMACVDEFSTLQSLGISLSPTSVTSLISPSESFPN